MESGAKSWARALVPVATISLAVVAALAAIQLRFGRGPARAGMAKVGDSLPAFSFTRLDGSVVEPNELGAQVIFVNFWASWCDSCLVEMPSIARMGKRFANRGLAVVAVNVDDDPRAAAPPAMKELGIDLPIYVDPGGKLATLFSLTAIPLTVVITSARKVLWVEAGERDWDGDASRNLFESWLGGRG